MDPRILPRRSQLPVAVDVAVQVQSAAEAGLGIDSGEVGEVRVGQPAWQRLVAMAVAEKTFAVLDELLRRGIGQAAAGKYRAHRKGDIAFELSLGDAGRLKILPVEVGDAIGPQGLKRPAGATNERRKAKAGD